jgi:NAD(P)-dependent dehydrogenase (short-subunit alcohol dehydrogenase family)
VNTLRRCHSTVRALTNSCAPISVFDNQGGGPREVTPPRIIDGEGDQVDRLPIGRVVGPADIAALAIHLMTNTAVTGATFDIDGGQQLIDG